MDCIYELKDDKYNLHLLALYFQSLDYSVNIMKKKKRELLKNPVLKRKVDNYILLTKAGWNQNEEKNNFDFNFNEQAKCYLRKENNIDLREYINICKHIVAKELDKGILCSKIDFRGHHFKIVGRDLVGVDCNFSTRGLAFTSVERDFLCSCAKRKGLVVGDEFGKKQCYNVLYNSNCNNVVSPTIINVA